MRVVVLGSGAAGLSAALVARAVGAEVLVAEATTTIGGTSALSSGAVWAPNNGASPQAASDSAELARRYLRSLAYGDVAPALLDRYLTEAPRVVTWLGEHASLCWQPLPLPDCYRELPGGSKAGVRSLEPAPVRVDVAVSSRMRGALPKRPPFTLAELAGGEASPELAENRARTGTVVGGQALIAALTTAALAAGVDIRTSTRVRTLSSAEELAGGPSRIVLATGGFERDPVLVQRFLGSPLPGLIGAPGAVGDGLRMAMAAGAELGNMAEAWWCPTVRMPGEEIEGHVLHRMLFTERARPGTIMVGAHGRRFTNEARNYNEVGRALHAFSPAGFFPGADPAWLVFDAAARRGGAIGTLAPQAPDPSWLIRADTVRELAGHLGVPAEVLEHTVRDFNQGAESGTDPEFGRGTGAYDRAIAALSGTTAILRPLEAPYYAVPVHAGAGGTKGGPRTDDEGRMLDLRGRHLPGLYAAGNAAASPFGMAYPGTGTTLGQALVFGHLAGRAAATD
ncbi:FAD-dependent oxidoreductase [Acrocarpospora catenulata]|uniref:FAD-dependent oxidoreductase n=1 Tax=Acrocarpospora catenulata TaxID=2836182 RepID=UPI001BDAEC07|nr:FAD-dependent oxidoreductase [Acrocarpospora catenulata]